MQQKTARISRDERKERIIEAFEENTGRTRFNRALTVGQIANMCKLSKSPYLRQLIDELVDEDRLRMEGYDWTGGVCPVKCLYCLPEYHRPMTDNQLWLGRQF